MPSPEQAAEWRRQYADGATLREIADRFGVHEATVRRAIPDPRRTGPRGRPDITVQDALDAIAEYGSQRAAADALGVSRTLLRTRLHEAGLAPEPHGRGAP
jgi:DNA-binding FadR family transcriptional regulator